MVASLVDWREVMVDEDSDRCCCEERSSLDWRLADGSSIAVIDEEDGSPRTPLPASTNLLTESANRVVRWMKLRLLLSRRRCC